MALVNTTYKSGETPEVGDKVKLQKNHSLDIGYYSDLRLKETYEIESISNGSKSVLVKLVGRPPLYKALNFDLKVQSQNKRNNGKMQRFVINNNGKFVTAENKQELEEKLKSLLAKNPSSKFPIYAYINTAQTKTPEIVYTNEVQITDGTNTNEDPATPVFSEKSAFFC